jgi:A/G-specific adenine glycosylase
MPLGLDDFRNEIYRNYSEHGRVLPWRLTRDPYRILVSELMLQQTQVERVTVKYEQFICAFPDFRSLAGAPLDGILLEWQGLGYNRRAMALKKIALRVTEDYGGILPRSPAILATLPGVGNATASAIAAFAFNIPAVFIETNIRTVFIYFFFKKEEKISDREILPLVEQSLDRDQPRTWYYALMDYGVMLKRSGEAGHRKSTSYRKQAAFRGSSRQARGKILRLLLAGHTLSRDNLIGALSLSPETIEKLLTDLQAEGFIRESCGSYSIA